MAAAAGRYHPARRGPGGRGRTWPSGIHSRRSGRQHSADPGRTRIPTAGDRHRPPCGCSRLPARRRCHQRHGWQRGHFYIWPGVPRDLLGAVRFFATRGWQPSHDTLDLVTDLRRYRPPPGAYEHAAAKGITVTRPDSAGLADVLAFEAATFPSWSRWFAVSAPAGMLIARDDAGHIAGTLLLRGPGADTVFAPMLGLATGTIGCVGVAAPKQGEGLAPPWSHAPPKSCETPAPATVTLAGQPANPSIAAPATSPGGDMPCSPDLPSKPPPVTVSHEPGQLHMQPARNHPGE
jgi:hypothetical protein